MLIQDSPATTAEPTAPRLTAADLMTRSPRTCSPFSTITEAALIFRDADCGAMPVLDEGKPVGILTDRDIALAIAQYPDLPNRPVSDIMIKDVVTVPTDAPLKAVEEAFGAHQIRRLLVVGPKGQLEGIIAWADLVPYLPEREVGHVVAEVIQPPVTDDQRVTSPAKSPVPRKDRTTGGEKRSSTPGSWYYPGSLWTLVKETGREWMEDKVPRLGAALAFYSVLSLAPMLLIAIAIAGLVFGREATQGHLVEQIRGLVGTQGGEAVEMMLAHSRKPGTGTVAAILGVATLLVGASGVVAQLQDALNTIWEVAPKPNRGLMGIIKDRFLSLALVLGLGFLLLVSLVLSAALAALGTFFGGLVSQSAPVLETANFAVSLVVITLLFAMIYKLLPDARIAWRDVWVGAVMTALLFTLGKSLIGLYLGRSSIGSTYGAAGSLVVLLVWVYYSSQILFFGAEFTKTYANRFGSRIVPASDAVPVTEEARAQQGMPRTEAVAAEARRERRS
jgi:membrane protein